MSGKISDFLREYILIFSIVLTVLGIIVFFIGVTGTFFREFLESSLNLSGDILDWSAYILVFGFIVLAFGIYYLYVFLKNKKFILKELKTNKRSELKKTHLELKRTVKHMPSKYKKMLKEKEEELHIR